MANQKAPGVTSNGINDKSSLAPVVIPEVLPDSLIIGYGFAQKGDATPRYVAGCFK